MRSHVFIRADDHFALLYLLYSLLFGSATFFCDSSCMSAHREIDISSTTNRDLSQMYRERCNEKFTLKLGSRRETSVSNY